MRHYLLSICCLFFTWSGYSQSEVNNFYSAMTTAPISDSICTINVVYDYDTYKFDSLQTKWTKFSTPSKLPVYLQKARDNELSRYSEIGKLIDRQKLVDYKSDTIYELSTFYLGPTNIFQVFKTGNGLPFYFTPNASGDYDIQYIDKQWYYRGGIDNSAEAILHETVFSGDIDKFIRLIKSSSIFSGGEYHMTATRTIIKNHRVIRADFILFEPALWRF